MILDSKSPFREGNGDISTIDSMDPELPEAKAAFTLAFIIQARPDIRKKVQRVERLKEKSLRDLGIVAKRVFNKSETTEEKQMRGQR